MYGRNSISSSETSWLGLESSRPNVGMREGATARGRPNGDDVAPFWNKPDPELAPLDETFPLGGFAAKDGMRKGDAGRSGCGGGEGGAAGARGGCCC